MVVVGEGLGWLIHIRFWVGGQGVGIFSVFCFLLVLLSSVLMSCLFFQ